MRSLLLILLVFACSVTEKTSDEISRWKQQAKEVTIIRDDYGIPHVYGKSDADAVFGLLYAQCEDDFPRVEKNFAWAIGRLSEGEGEKSLYSDLRARLFMTQEEAMAYYNSAPEWLKKLCNAWADGINYYLYTHPHVKPIVLKRFEPWMTMYFTEGSIGGDIERVSTEKIKNFYENKKTLAVQEDVMTFLKEPKGSNGIAISGKLTASGNAMLLINPHTSFYFRGEVHAISEEGLNAYGAVTWGQFFVYQGFNEHTGWMHTSTYTDVIDDFVETISKKEKKLYYKYGNEEREVEVKTVTLKYKQGDEMKQRTFPIYRTHHGPITHTMGDDKWVASALMWDPVKALEQSYIRMKKKNHKQFYEMMDIRTNSSNNTVFADSEGNIAYYHGNFIPKRDETFDYSKPVDGSNPATDWTGLHTLEESIIIVNPANGWIQNCNSTPFTVAAEYSPQVENYPRYMSLNRENYRGVHAIQLLQKASKLTLDDLIDLSYDPYLPAFEKVIPALIDAYENTPNKNPDLAQPIAILKQWDLTTSKTSVAMTLAHYYGTNLYRTEKAPKHFSGMEKFDYYGTDFPKKERVKVFANTIEKLQNTFGTWNMAWGEISRFQRLTGDINAGFDDEKPSVPVGFSTARWGALASYGTWTKQNTKKIYGTAGNSFVAAIEFGDKIIAKSILVGGQSANPNSKHFVDQVEPYINADFKDVAFYEEDIKARSEETYHPGDKKE